MTYIYNVYIYIYNINKSQGSLPTKRIFFISRVCSLSFEMQDSSRPFRFSLCHSPCLEGQFQRRTENLALLFPRGTAGSFQT